MITRQITCSCNKSQMQILKRKRPHAANFPFREKLKVSLQQYTRACWHGNPCEDIPPGPLRDSLALH